jgi:hypothetical protein
MIIQSPENPQSNLQGFIWYMTKSAPHRQAFDKDNEEKEKLDKQQKVH